VAKFCTAVKVEITGDTPSPYFTAAACRQGGWLAEFAELGTRAGGQLLSAASATAATAAGSSFSSSSSTAATAAAGGSGGGSFSGTSHGNVTGGGAGLSGGGAPLGSSGQTGSNLTFRFDLAASDLTPHDVSSSVGIAGGAGAAAVAAAAVAGGGGAAAAAGDERGYGSLLKRGLGQNAGGPYLTPAGPLL
jgi:hypothetical protein